MCLNAGPLGAEHENRRPMNGKDLPYIICRRNHVSKPHVRGERVLVIWVVLSGRAVRLHVRSDYTGRRMASYVLDVTRLRAH
jgi:hypothetical protein